MRETKTGFGAKAGFANEGGLQPEDESDEEGDEDEEEGDEDIGQDDDEDEESDHNF
jgi:hypothetical protein